MVQECWNIRGMGWGWGGVQTNRKAVRNTTEFRDLKGPLIYHDFQRPVSALFSATQTLVYCWLDNGVEDSHCYCVYIQ